MRGLARLVGSDNGKEARQENCRHQRSIYQRKNARSEYATGQTTAVHLIDAGKVAQAALRRRLAFRAGALPAFLRPLPGCFAAARR